MLKTALRQQALHLSPLTKTSPRTLKTKPLPTLATLFGLSLFSTSTPAHEHPMASAPPKVQKSEQEWRAVLSPEQFRVLRKQGTEAPGSSPFDKHKPSSGTYNCAGCDAPLYTAQHKFPSGCGWPAFFDAIPGAITRHEDRSMFMKRVEIVCTNCGGHLGHVFAGEGYNTPTDERHCVNGISLNFKE